MATPNRRPTAGDGQEDSEQIAVTAHRCSEDRVVFVEQDNSDAWIATDTTVDTFE
ncbi:MAG: hypothetical protein J07HX64_00161 [halophilic archaeon J07HX64]|jgi:hypothetical protein|nr:MAG: hypothetical protein J07HX64_00161 [halophilic archaeon J07HX64]